jgi:hypothetical protein
MMKCSDVTGDGRGFVHRIHDAALGGPETSSFRPIGLGQVTRT